MRAVQYRTIGANPEVIEVPNPRPAGSQVLLRMTAAGLCHSDVFVMSLPKEQFVFGDLPLTLGHEGVGIVEAVGPDGDASLIGDAVAIYGPWGCGRCLQCSQGHENYCSEATTLGIMPPGLGSPGCLSEYMIVDHARHLVPIGDLDPTKAAPLTDAGLTPYHSIRTSLSKLGAGTTAVVIGTGGLGHVAVQILKALSGCRIIALDIDAEKLEVARKAGADVVMLSDAPDVVDAVRTITGGAMAQGVFDFAGFQSSVDLAGSLVGVGGDLRIIGIGMGGVALPVGFFLTPYEANVGISYWGYRHELIEVIAMATQGQIDVEIETFSLDEAPRAYTKLKEGSLRGRAVVRF